MTRNDAPATSPRNEARWPGSQCPAQLCAVEESPSFLLRPQGSGSCSSRRYVGCLTQPLGGVDEDGVAVTEAGDVDVEIGDPQE